MRIDLSGKNAIVTGGASGIGKACTLALAKAGAKVLVVDVDGLGAKKTIDEIGSGQAFACDLGDADAIVAMRDEVLTAAGGVDIIVNCAGLIFYRNGIEAVDTAEWDLVMKINLRGTFLVCRAFMDSLKTRKDGRIITCSSMAARVGGIEVGAHYTASKAGLIGLTRTLAKEGGAFGITANAVAPGIIRTGPVKEQIVGNEDAYRDQIPLGCLGEPEDVANSVVFLASPQSSYISGIVLDINGGMYMA